MRERQSGVPSNELEPTFGKGSHDDIVISPVLQVRVDRQVCPTLAEVYCRIEGISSQS